MMAHFQPGRLEQLCSPEFLAAGGGPLGAWNETLRLPELDGVDRYAALDTHSYLPGDLLLKVDRMSMAHSLEVRSPLLDYRVHEFAARLPGASKLRRGQSKWLLKQLAARRGLPHDLVHRRKRGFGIPIGGWMRGPLRPWIDGLLLDPVTRDRGYFRPEAVAQLLQSHHQGKADETYRLWNLAMLELWHRRFIDREGLSTSQAA
jgi:asparagine synthase (glutamine-hydrolysing)